MSQQWTQIGSSINGEAAFDNSGVAIDLSSDGKTVIIGATGNDGSFNSAGHARVFHYNGSIWNQKGTDLDGEAQYDGSGTAVAINSTGDIIAIGSASNSGGGSAAGHVRVYEWDGSGWIQKGTDIDGDASSSSGTSIDLNSDGTILIIGAPNHDGGANNAGAVKIFEWSGSDWVQKGTTIYGDAANDQFGFSVSICKDGNTIAAGAPINSGQLTNAGQVKVYEWGSNDWVLKGSDLFGEAAADRFGYSVSIDTAGTTLAVGGIWNSDGGSKAGHVRIFHWTGSSWAQKGIDLNGEAYDDNAGWSVAICGNGNKVVIGAKGNDGTFGTNATAGQIRIYSWNGNSWFQVGNDIDGESGSDFFGYSVAINEVGDIVAGGASWNSNAGTSAGDVRIFGAPSFSSSNTIDKLLNLSIYPNPSTDVFYIKSDLLISSIEVYAMDGRKILQKSGATNTSIDLSGYSIGLYCVSITDSLGNIETVMIEKQD
ncbi:MAG: T9SS type A sorting domain-containing protein [Flavobacteriales bacterium]|nr:T9SS type A sorting domain-containing protein [Flavobacteriales bacterium]MCB9197232.1 T9SS type A sorting domain-containing protein [Flavobacteriales bacterium]